MVLRFDVKADACAFIVYSVVKLLAALLIEWDIWIQRAYVRQINRH